MTFSSCPDTDRTTMIFSLFKDAFEEEYAASPGLTGDPRTIKPTTSITLAARGDTYTAEYDIPDDHLGLVVGYYSTATPRMTNPVDYAQYEAANRTSFEMFNFIYKVWVPTVKSELNLCDFNDANKKKFLKKVAGMSDVTVSVGVTNVAQGAIPPGTLVRVAFADTLSLANPQIVKIIAPKAVAINTLFPDPPGRKFVMGAYGAPTVLGNSGGGGKIPSSIPPNPTSWPSPLPEVKTNRVLWLGDSQSDNTYLTSTIKTKLKERGIDVKLLAKYGQGVLSGMKAKGGASGPAAISGGSKADYFGVNKENGHLVSYMKSFRPGLVIIELGGNDSNWYSASSKKAAYQEQLALWAKTVKDLGAQLIWLGPSFSGKPEYQKKREVIAAYQQEYLTSAGIPWYDMKPLTQDLQHKQETTPVHFVAASYKKWAHRLLDGPLKDVKAKEDTK